MKSPTMPSISVPYVPRLSTRKRPSVEVLASVAASMASAGEDPKQTASRALALFEACEDELFHARCLDRKTEKSRLARMKEEATLRELFGEGDGDAMVPLDVILKVSMPAESKEDRRMEKWKRFRKWYLEEYRLIHGGKLTPLSASDAFKFDREHGLVRKDALTAIFLFRAWLDEERGRIVQDKAAKSARSKIYLPVCRQLSRKEHLDPDDLRILAGMSDEEIANAKAKIGAELGPGKGRKFSRLLDAAIDDANSAARPRAVRKKSP
ncbi:MAG: hypothetical protein H7A50_08335 [Akkermansiaceae bacterium]|nr:hypothetical protein [Akkermansiaceae bacterium]